MIQLVVFLSFFHIVGFAMSVSWKYDIYRYDKMSHVEWARYKIKCFFWEVFAPYVILRWVIYAAQEVYDEVYDTVTTALQKKRK